MRSIVVFLLLFVSQNLMSQKTIVIDPLAKIKTDRIDHSKVEVRKINEDAIYKYSKQKEFIYDDVSSESLSWWDRFWKTFWEFIKRIFSSGQSGKSIGWLPVFMKYFSIALAIGIIVFVAIKVIGLDLKMLFKKSRVIDIPYEESLENIHEIDFGDQLEKALQSQNFRLAVRLLYLQTLKHLADKELINWQPEKTNITYVLELSNGQHKVDFETLTYQFEHVWYGDFAIKKGQFERIDLLFQQFNQQVK